MKSNILILLMSIIWLTLMANIICNATNGKWIIEDAEKIGTLEVAKYTNQIIVVANAKEETRLCFYEKNLSDQWELVLETEAIIGKHGLGKRKEGDGKTPVGTFLFTEAFGILENPGAKMKYTQVDEQHYWVDDSNSTHYNKFTSIEDVIVDWNSAEHLCEFGESYHYVLSTSYNVQGIPGAGSAVFLHCASAEAQSTAGCIAIPEVYMKTLVRKVEANCILIIDEADEILNY